MMKKSKPAIPNFSHMVHGADYNPDQWLNHPEIIEEDMRLMKLARNEQCIPGHFRVESVGTGGGGVYL